jgi:hypothetical protein
MAAKAKLPRTIKNVGYAMITSVDNNTGKPTYGDVNWLVHNEAGGREYTAEPKGEVSSIYADGVEVYSEEENAGYDITLTLLAFIDDTDEDWLNRVVDSDGQFVEEYANTGEYPHFALFIMEDTTDGVGQIRVFYDCHCTKRPTESGKTSEGGALDPMFPEYAISAVPREDCACVERKIKGKTKLTNVPEPSLSGNHIQLNKTMTLTVGSTADAPVISKAPGNAAVTWSSGTESVATVSSAGVVTGVSAGTSVITASITVSGTSYTGTCTVTVVAAT